MPCLFNFKSEGSAGIYKLVGDSVQDSDLVASDAEGVTTVLNKKVAFIKVGLSRINVIK